LRGNVVDLAVAVVIGVAFGLVISAFTDKVVKPVINAITPANSPGLGFTVIPGKDTTYIDVAQHYAALWAPFGERRMATSRGPIPDLPASAHRRVSSVAPAARQGRQPGPSRDQVVSRPSAQNHCWPADQVMKSRTSRELVHG